MKFNEEKALLLFSGMLTGILVATLFFNSSSFKPTAFLTYKQYQKLNMEANELKNEVEGLNKAYNELDRKLYKYNISNEKDKSVLETLSKELEEAKMFYGDTPVEGSGIKVTINDNHEHTNYFELIDGITHNYDIYNIVNELKNGGAEAISVNGNRIASNTSINCGGPTILINDDTYITPPFEIMAIGDPDALEYTLMQQQSYYHLLQIRGLELNITKMKDIKMDSVIEVKKPTYLNSKR